MKTIFDLTPEQQKAFNRLKKAYNDCKKTGILFVNVYSTLHAYDKRKIKDYGDNVNDMDNPVPVLDVFLPSESIEIAHEWADDESCHFYDLTEKGLKIYNEQ